ncbi:MAG TPA: hypothetical protein PKA88_20975 [Polyangiaceae bacterium]|nr:hypothetical protein [Polyangiaceae bacterium]HMR75377.1 hypothetical protein [Polyangiaceae bacterium]
MLGPDPFHADGYAGRVGIALLAAMLIATGCSGSEASPDSGTDGGAEAAGDAGVDGAWQCSGQAGFMCAPGCGGDLIHGPVCGDAGWACPSNMVRTTDCPDDTCFTYPPDCCAADGAVTKATCPDQGSPVCPPDTVQGNAYLEPCTKPPGCEASPCTGGSYCAFRDDDCGKTWPGVCKEKPASCSSSGPPACGCDDVVYANDCLAQQAGVDLGTGCTPPSGLLLCGTHYCDPTTHYCQLTVPSWAPMSVSSECVPIPADCTKGANCACLSNQPCAGSCANSQPMPTVTCFE